MGQNGYPPSSPFLSDDRDFQKSLRRLKGKASRLSKLSKPCLAAEPVCLRALASCPTKHTAGLASE